ncbi:MAG: phosphonate ABC transporter, permease protein PhnE [Rhodospirillaceae bacterium]|nr:phosphonate ABC transporter, permease protein PhnE [Rhodospirillaceae bacterium]
MNVSALPTGQRWRFPPPIGLGAMAAWLLFAFVLAQSAGRVEIGRMLALSGEAVQAAVGLRADSQVGRGLGVIIGSMFPIQLEDRTDVRAIPGFDPAAFSSNLPWRARIETEQVSETRVDPQTLEVRTVTTTTQVLVRPFGYALHVLAKLVETVEIALWGTVIAVILSLPLAVASARPYAPHGAIYVLARTVVGALRSVPEMVSALFLVLAYGFGPIAGVLALALHSAGFLGKFYAEDIENADPKAQEALTAIGAGRMKVLRFAVLPEVWPQYIAYTFYVLDRNVRMATVIGIVGAGGIGQELKGRFDMFNYAHVGTILLAILLLVLLLDQLSARLRRSAL